MIYVSGSVREGWPAMLTPMMWNRMPEEGLWAADTGCFAKPELYDDDRYIEWLSARAEHRDRCLFATAPDRFGDGPATLEVALPMLPRIRGAGYPVALVLQPGITGAQVPWDAIDWVFVGGPNAWQHSADLLELVHEAHDRGKRVHVGRVNTLWRLKWAASIGADSCDGTTFAFGPDKRIPEMERWLAEVNTSPSLWTPERGPDFPYPTEAWEMEYQLRPDPEVDG